MPETLKISLPSFNPLKIFKQDNDSEVSRWDLKFLIVRCVIMFLSKRFLNSFVSDLLIVNERVLCTFASLRENQYNGSEE